MSDADDVQDEFDALGRMLRGLVTELQPIDRTMGRFTAGGPKCARTIEQHYEGLRELETRLRALAYKAVFTIEELEDLEAETAEAAEVAS